MGTFFLCRRLYKAPGCQRVIICQGDIFLNGKKRGKPLVPAVLRDKAEPVGNIFRNLFCQRLPFKFHRAAVIRVRAVNAAHDFRPPSSYQPCKAYDFPFMDFKADIVEHAFFAQVPYLKPYRRIRGAQVIGSRGFA